MNVLSAILVAVGAAFSVDLARRVSGSLDPRDRRRYRHRPDPDRLGRRDPRRPARPPLRPARDHPVAARPLGGDAPGARSGDVGRAHRRRPARRPPPARRGRGRRRLSGEPLADTPPGPADPPVRLEGGARDLRPPPVRRRLHRCLRDPDGPDPVRDDPARRVVPGPVRLRRSQHVERLLVHHLGAAVPRLVHEPAGGLAEADLGSRRDGRQPAGTPGAARRPRVRRDRGPPTPDTRS